MKRLNLTPRPDWQKEVESVGMTYHTVDDRPYWDESACFEFTKGEVDTIEEATNTLQELVIKAVEHIIDNNLFSQLRLNEQAKKLILSSWNDDERSLYGRFDLVYDGTGFPKMLEYNADTPTSLFEASVVQWYWKEAVFPSRDQFNSLHERLVKRWGEMDIKGRLYFSALQDTLEDYGNVRYLAQTASEGGLWDNDFIYVQDIGYNQNAQEFRDVNEQKIENIFKLYPWEWMLSDQFGQYVERTRFIEPAWKMLLSNKALLPILWKLFPYHPNLLESSFQPISGDYVRKPLLGREGANVTIYKNGQVTETEGSYGDSGYIYQKFQELPNMGGGHVLIGSWIVGEEAAGMGVREDENPVTGNTSRFVPHIMDLI